MSAGGRGGLGPSASVSIVRVAASAEAGAVTGAVSYLAKTAVAG